MKNGMKDQGEWQCIELKVECRGEGRGDGSASNEVKVEASRISALPLSLVADSGIVVSLKHSCSAKFWQRPLWCTLHGTTAEP